MPPLVLADVPEPLWHAFQSSRSGNGDDVGGLDEAAPAGRTESALRRAVKSASLSTFPSASAAIASVVTRWRRAASLGVPADGPEDEQGLLRGAALRDRTLRAGLDRLHDDHDARRILEQTSQKLSLRDFTLLLADTDGVVLRRLGGGDFNAEARRVRLIEGASWGEAARGTNAIGTALAESRSVEVHGRSHFGRRFHGLCCYATPIRGAAGEIAFVLDATSFAQRADSAVGGIVEQAARALEDVLRGHAYASAGASVARLLSRTFDRLAHPVLLVEAPGRIVRLNAAARAHLAGTSSSLLSMSGDNDGDVWGDGIPRSIEQALGDPTLTYERLVRRALDPSPTTELRTRAPRFASSGAADSSTELRVQVDPVETGTGALLGIVVHLEPIPSPRRAASVAPPPPPSSRSPGFLHPSSSPGDAPSDPAEVDSSAGSVGASASASSGTSTFFRGTLFAEDPTVQRAATFATRVAKSTLPVVLLAETGTGKELFARGIHRESDRARAPFVALNCGAVTAELLTSELFGHGPSAFTGATAKGRHGLLHAAQGGTLFLDEVAEMPPAMQTALLRVLEDGTYQRVGETEPRRTDVRLIAATCRDLEALVDSGAFRKDLYYRLRGVTIRIPPLRSRTDRSSLVDHLLARLAPDNGPPRRVAPALRAWLDRQPFPGNVRELRSVLSVALVLAGDEELGLEHLPPGLIDLAELQSVADNQDSLLDDFAAPREASAPGELRAVTGKLVRDTLSELSGNVSAAARKLGVARSTLYRRLRKGAGAGPSDDS